MAEVISRNILQAEKRYYSYFATINFKLLRKVLFTNNFNIIIIATGPVQRPVQSTNVPPAIGLKHPQRGWPWRSYFTQWRWRNGYAWVVQSVMRRQCFWRETIGQMLFFLMLFVSLHSPSLHTRQSFQHVLRGNFLLVLIAPVARCCYIRRILQQQHSKTVLAH